MESQTFRTVHIQKLQYRSYHDQTPTFDGRKLWFNRDQAKLLTYEETCKPSLGANFRNGFFSAFLQAYNCHGDVKITPDDVWLTIMLYFSKYVNDHAEQLRSAFVSHQGKKKLTVTTWKELSETQWDEFFTLMMEEIKKNTAEGVTAKFQCDFSTTRRVEKILSTAIVMNTYKKYFDYGRCIPLCGIQNVHFGGTLDDWKKLISKTEKLVQFDVNGALKTYVKSVIAILQKFVQTYQGNVDVDYWNKIIKVKGNHGSGASEEYSGWLMNFFGYYHQTDEVTMDSIEFEIEIDNKITGIVKKVTLVGGFLAVSKQGKVFRPHLSMAIRDAVEKESENKGRFRELFQMI